VDPHAPYSAPDAWAASGAGFGSFPEGLPSVAAADGVAAGLPRIERLRELYHEEVRYADARFGEFLDALRWLGLYEDSLIVLTSDHGEEFGEHGGLEHGKTLFDESLRIPLVVRYPGGREAGAEEPRPVSLVDVAPTVLAAAGLSTPGNLDGSPLPTPRARAAARPLYTAVAPAQHHLSPLPRIDLQALRTADLKCIEDRGAGRYLVFDLDADPGERKPLAAESVGAQRCLGALRRWQLSRQAIPDDVPREEAGDEVMDRLRALGYVR
jgi:arylsulfatase A-like enzyme